MKRRAAALLVAGTVAFSGCAKQSSAPHNESATDYAKLRVALLNALAQDAKNRGVPWTHPIETIVWKPDGIVIVEKTSATKSVHDDCALAIAASMEANEKLTNHLYRQQNDPNYDPQATPVWPVKVQNANGALMTRFDPNAESGPKC